VSADPATTDLLRALVPVLGTVGGRWYVFGAQAVLVWGRPRLTGEVDVTVFLDPEAPDAFVAAMESARFVLRVANVGDFVARTRVFPFTHAASGLAVDVVLGGPGLEEEFLRTARPVDDGGVVVPVIGPQELIVTKILAGRAKDLDDVQGILRAQADALDESRVRTLLRELHSARSPPAPRPGASPRRGVRGRPRYGAFPRSDVAASTPVVRWPWGLAPDDKHGVVPIPYERSVTPERATGYVTSRSPATRASTTAWLPRSAPQALPASCSSCDSRSLRPRRFPCRATAARDDGRPRRGHEKGAEQ